MITSINEFKKNLKVNVINEKFNSSILTNIYKTIRDKHEFGRNSSLYKHELSELKDEDFTRLTPTEARSKKHVNNEDTLFWMDKDDRLVAISTGKYITYINSYLYRNILIKKPSSLQVAQESEYVYLVNLTTNRPKKRVDRYSARSGATALMDPEYVKEENLNRYRNILIKKRNNLGQVEEIVKYFLDKYTGELGNLSLSEDEETRHKRYDDKAIGSGYQLKNKVKRIGDKLTYMLDKYDTLVNIMNDAKNDRVYSHQEKEKINIEKQFQIWKEQDDVIAVTPNYRGGRR